MMSKNEYNDKNFITYYQQRVWKKTPGDKVTLQHCESRQILSRINDAQIESAKMLHFLSDAQRRKKAKSMNEEGQKLS